MPSYGVLLVGLIVPIDNYKLYPPYTPQIPQGQKQSGKAEEAKPSMPEHMKETVVSLRDTNNTFLSWSVLILGASFGLIFAGIGNTINRKNWTLAFIPPAWIYLAVSIYYGIYIKARMTYFLAKGSFSPFALNRELWFQLFFFWMALVPLAIIIFIYFFYRFFQTAKMEEK